MTHELVSETGIPYGSGGGHLLFLDILRPDNSETTARPAVVWVHGGGWQAGQRQPNPNRTLAEHGFVTATISYRLSQEAIFPAQIHDVKAAIRFLRGNHERFGIDPDRIGVWGHSAGGHLAALAGVAGNVPELEGDGGTPGVSSVVQAAVPLSPPTRLDQPTSNQDLDSAQRQLLGHSVVHRAELDRLARLASPATHARADTPPFLIVHGVVDNLVTIEDARALAAALATAGAPVTLRELPGVDHSDVAILGPIDGPITPVHHEIVAFFEATLRLVED
ncbi:MAG: alpha/beta hydrolase [Chloroflexia bacterium]|nr:alpha/beta hydrolase [Chloroflexia bacterium]